MQLRHFTNSKPIPITYSFIIIYNFRVSLWEPFSVINKAGHFNTAIYFTT